MPAYINILKSKWFLLILGVLVGALVVLAIRFISYNPPVTHYHANFAVYINGVREKFTGSKYYEETASTGCSLNPVQLPVERAHMHSDINDVVHVHDKLVTWGNLFQNIKWGLADEYLKTVDQVLVPDVDHKLTFILNGKTVKSVAYDVIGDEDRLLINYGGETTDQLQKQFDSVASTAHAVDVAKDPATCSAGSKVITLQDRIDHLF